MRFTWEKQFLIYHGEAVINSCDLLFLSPWRSREKEIVISCEVLFLIIKIAGVLYWETTYHNKEQQYP